MKTLKTSVSLFLFALAAVGGLIGCGGGGGTPNGGASSTGTGGSSAVGKAVTGQLLRADQNGAALAGATVRLVSTGKATASRHTRDVGPVQTDANGNYAFTNVPPDSYTVQASTANGSYQEADVPVTVQQATQVPPLGLIPANVQVDHINIVLPAPDGPNGHYVVQHTYTFTAQVFDKSGNLLANWQPSWTVEGGIGTIDAQGKFVAANTGGVGKVDAYLYVKDQQVLFRSPDITVVPASTLTPVPLTTLAPNVGGHSNYGVDVFDAASGAENLAQSIPSLTKSAFGDGGLLAKDSAGTLYVYDYSASPPTIYTITNGTKQALLPLPSPITYPSAAYAMTVLPSGHLLVATYVVAFGYNGFTVLQPNGIWSAYQLANQYATVRAMTVGPDGKLYVSGRQNSIERLDRYAISGDNLTFETTLISKPGNSEFGDIGFARNGDMILADFFNNQLLAYTSSGSPTQKLIKLPHLSVGISQITDHSHFAIGHSILKQNDEILFVVSQDGIYRVDYTNGNFAAVDKDSVSNPTVFLPSRNGGRFEDLLLNY